MAADAQAGSSNGGNDQLERVITSQCQKLLSDKETAANEKLNHFAQDFESWVSAEPNIGLSDPPTLVDVTKHASFGRIKAKIMASCCCGKAPGNQPGTIGAVAQPNHQCSLHSPEVQLHDLVFEIAQAVHQVFTDNWLCFVHVLQDRCEAGPIGVAGDVCWLEVDRCQC